MISPIEGGEKTKKVGREKTCMLQVVIATIARSSLKATANGESPWVMTTWLDQIFLISLPNGVSPIAANLIC